MVKVNAQCDEGVASLVVALNEIDGVITLDSCQDCYPWGANVFFTYGRNRAALAGLLQRLSTELSKLELPFGFSSYLSWMGSNDRPRAHLCVEPESVDGLAQAIRRVLPNLNCRRSASSDGR
jgi:hypothetical protein